MRTRKLCLLQGLFCGFILAFGAISPSACAQTTAPNEWTWVGGSNTVTNGGIQPAVYGKPSIFAAGNIPGGRAGATSRIDSNGKLWLFGGNSTAASGIGGELNDLWEFDPVLNDWAWMGGSNATNQSGIYGTLGTPAKNNLPGGRSYAMAWVDSAGSFWLFGGNGYDANGNSGTLNDLWKFNPLTSEWAWMGGSSAMSCVSDPYGPTVCGQAGVYGTLGTPAAGNVPAGRYSAAGWTDKNGDFWLFGGCNDIYCASSLNDLWKFDPATNEWAWIGGNSAIDQLGVYGTLGTPAAGNSPGSRYSAVTWTDGSGHLWLYGGEGYDSIDNVVYLNDLWEFNPSTDVWAWMGGSSTVGPDAVRGAVFGTLGAPDSGNNPGSRSNAIGWTDSGGNFWLLGGEFDIYSNPASVYNFQEYNDVWEFNSYAGEWVWMGGTDSTACVVEFLCSHPVVYGALNTPAIGNFPGYREGADSWVDRSGNFWLFGGKGFDALGDIGILNDMWVYQPVSATFPAAAPTFSISAGTYTTTQSVAISDATAGTTIYYTTDGTTPNTSSTLYSGPITISSTQTVEAVATASGYSTSAVASATYTIPPDFSVASTPASSSVTAGQYGTTSISVTPANGFNSTVSFSCSGLPAGATCIFSPSTVTPSGSAASTTLSISTTTSMAAIHRHAGPLFPIGALAALACCMGWKRCRLVQPLGLIVVCAIAFGLLNGCGGGGSSTGGPVTPQSATYTITVNATSGLLQHSTTFALTVN
jgi:N-acetylneuraminic acid mutarotase